MQPENQEHVNDEIASGIERMRRLVKERRQREQIKRAREQQTDEVEGNITRVCLWVQQQRELTNAAEVPLQSPAASQFNPPSEWRMENAFNYVDDVKNTYIDQPDVFQEFLYTLQKAKYHILDRQGVLTSIAQLFVDHPRLIVGFNQFSPPDNIQEAQPPATPLVNPPRLRMQQALDYVEDVKNTYSNQRHIYQEFLFTLEKYKWRALNRQDVLTRVSQLFADQPRLIEAFNQFLPPDSQEVAPQPPAAPHVNQPRMTVGESLDYFDDIENTYINEPDVYTEFLRTLRDFQCRALDNEGAMVRVARLFRDNPRLIYGFIRFTEWPCPIPQETFSSNPNTDSST